MFGNQLSLGVTIALRDAFSRPAAQITKGFYSLDDAAYRSARGIRRSLGNIEVGYASVTRTLAAAAAVAATLAAPIKMSSQFARGLAEVGTIADQTSFSIENLRSRVLDLTGLGQDVTNTTSAVYESVSSGFLKTADAITVTSEAAKSGVAELTDTMTALNGLVSVLNAYRMSAGSAAKVSDMLFETIKLGRVRGSDLAATIGTVVPVAAGANMPLDQLLGTYSTMTLSGLNPSQAAQYLRQIVTGMQKPTAQSAKTAKALGLNWGASALDARHGDVMGMILEAWKRTGSGKDKESFFRLFGGKQSATGLMSLLARDNGDLWKQHVSGHRNTMVMDQYGMPMSSRDKAVADIMATTSQQALVLKESTKALAIQFGDAAESHVYPFVKGLASVVTFTRHLLESFPNFARIVYGLGSAFTFALVSFAAMQLWMIRMSPRVRDLLASLNVFSRRIGLITLTSKNVIPTFMGLAGVVALVAFTLRRLYNEGGGFHDWVNQKVLLVKALTYGVMHMTGLFADIPMELHDALDHAGILDQYIYWIRILGRVKLFFDGLFRGIKAGFEMQFVKLREAGRGVANFLERIGLKRIADQIRGFTSGLKIEESWVGTWINVGFTVGKVLAAIITIWTLTKTWRGAVLAVQGLWWLITRPVMLLKRVLWDGPVAAIHAMRSGLSAVMSVMSRLARMAAFKLFGPQVYGGRLAYGGGGGFTLRGGPLNGMGAPGAIVSQLQQSGNLGLWNRLRMGMGGGSAGLWRSAGWQQAMNQSRFRNFMANPNLGFMGNAMDRARIFGGNMLQRGANMRAAGANALFGARMALFQNGGVGGLAAAGLSKLKATGTSAFSALTSGVMAFGRGLMAVGSFFMFNPIGLAILGIVAAVGLLIWKWDAVKKAFVSFGQWLLKFKMFRILADGASSAWTKIKDGFTKYVSPVLEWFGRKLKWVTDLLGITSNAYENSIGNPLNSSLVKSGPTGVVVYQSAVAEMNRLNGWLNTNKAAFEAGNLNQANERVFRQTYLTAKQLGSYLPTIARQNGLAAAMLNNPALASLSDAALAKLKQVGDDWVQESADAAAEKNGYGPDHPSEVVTPMARAVEAGARAGTAKGIQDALSRPQWSGDKWLVNGMSPFAGTEARYMSRAATSRAGMLTSENYSSEMAELRGTVSDVKDAIHVLANKQSAFHLILDGKKMASGLIGHFGRLQQRQATRGAGGQ